MAAYVDEVVQQDAEQAVDQHGHGIKMKLATAKYDSNGALPGVSNVNEQATHGEDADRRSNAPLSRNDHSIVS